MKRKHESGFPGFPIQARMKFEEEEFICLDEDQERKREAASNGILTI